MAIILDAMGSDNFPHPEIEAAVNFCNQKKEKLILVGNEDILRSELVKQVFAREYLEIVHAPEIVEMWDKPVESARAKPNNSMAIGIAQLKTHEHSAFVTAGNTGGAMFNAIRTLGRIKGVDRPALPAVIPTQNGKCVMVDVGVNVDCRPEFLLQFAVYGCTYAKIMLGIQKPRVGLLSNGEEEGKGNMVVKETHQLLKKSKLNFVGNVEGKEVFGGKVDVVVSDGFVGNVFLKASEAVAKFMFDSLKSELYSNTRNKLGAALAKPAFRNLKKLMDPDEIGALPLLGVDGLVLIGHGRSNARAIESALAQAQRCIDANLLSEMKTAFQKELKH
jgi:glycerol-3-phosphate acyltransferase PlsX